jgi:DNA-binding MarR family transcriptional regulator
MDNLTPAARETLRALTDQPGNVHEIARRTGRSRSGTDKALRELAKATLIVKLDGGDPADGAPTRWQPTDHGHTLAAGLHPTTPKAQPAQPETDQAEPGDTNAQPAGDSDGDPGTGSADPARPEDDQPTGHPAAAGTGDPPATGGQAETTPAHNDQEASQAEADQPKICRGCGEQLPRVCPHCWQKTPSYCGKCRKDMPQARRGEPGEPTILPSGLPRLRPGELEQLVLKVIRQQPLPTHVGITGWTAQRVAIYLPGRSTGAIGNALNKLTKTGDVELIGEQPMRYQPTATGDTNPANPQHAGAKPAGSQPPEPAEPRQAGAPAGQPPTVDSN